MESTNYYQELTKTKGGKKMKIISKTISCLLAILMVTTSGYAAKVSPNLGLTPKNKGAEEITIKKNQEWYSLLDFDDRAEYDNASKGLIAAPDQLELRDDKGKLVWSQKAYEFIEDKDAPDTVNPSLWRHTQLNHYYGLFEVTEGIYQVRGYDMANITFVKGDTGWIVFDPLMTVECSKAAFELVKENLGDYPVVAIVISHPHVDHFGGIKGIVSEEEVKKNKIPIIVPEGFEEHAISENVYAGTAMGRRASYQYGAMLKPGELGSMAIGIGMGQSKGTISYITPTDTITKTGEIRTIDGVTMEFQMTPGTEAPAEMNTWFPEKKALWMAENCTGTLHNLYTLRGAAVRDGNAWAKYIMEAITLYGHEAEVVFQSHNWPHWGNEIINKYLLDNAAIYKFINDQTLMYINQGLTQTEIAEMIKLPEEMGKVWYTRQYYGTLAHNSKAVYQKYMGWYNGNPVYLAELTPTKSAKKFVEYMGNTDNVLKKAREDFEKGEYQWVAQITNILVFADPKNIEARMLCADAIEQLAYQAESGTWRNVYLSGARELREGRISGDKYRTSSSMDLRKGMTPTMLLDYMGIMLDSNMAEDLNFKANFIIADLKESYLLTVHNGVLLYQKDAKAEDVDVTWTTTKDGMLAMISGDAKALAKGVKSQGDTELLGKLTSSMTQFDFFFNIIEP